MVLDGRREKNSLIKLSTLPRGYDVICNNIGVSVEDWRIKTSAEGIHQLNLTSSSGWKILNIFTFFKKCNYQVVYLFCWEYLLGSLWSFYVALFSFCRKHSKDLLNLYVPLPQHTMPWNIVLRCLEKKKEWSMSSFKESNQGWYVLKDKLSAWGIWEQRYLKYLYHSWI